MSNLCSKTHYLVYKTRIEYVVKPPPGNHSKNCSIKGQNFKFTQRFLPPDPGVTDPTRFVPRVSICSASGCWFISVSASYVMY